MRLLKPALVAVAAGGMVVVILAAFAIGTGFAGPSENGDAALKGEGYRAANFVVW